MAESISINRNMSDVDEFGFESLKLEGLRLVQQLSGKIWTDYNSHDPGVTILEQFCYALTDLIYRTGFPVEDFLTNDTGKIDFTGQALHLPEKILPCRPATFADYRRLIFDRLPEIDNVWLFKDENAPAGLCGIALKLGPDAAGREQEVIEKVRKIYSEARNLCEDLAGIRVISEEECELHGRIEVMGAEEPAHILAGIYHVCAMHIAAPIKQKRLRMALESGIPLDELLDGPPMEHGVVPDSELETDRVEILITDLFAAVKEVAGVGNVKRLWLRKGGRDYFDTIENRHETALLRLVIPEKPEDIRVHLESASGRKLVTGFREFKARFDDLNFMWRSQRRIPDDLSSIYPVPRGARRNLMEFDSIQNLFPAIYGIDARGVPESAPAEAKAKAAQLKGYLLLFDQVMANYCANLQQIGSLFASGPAGGGSYFSQVVENRGNPPLDQIYPKYPARFLTELVHQYDPCNDRKSRVLDYLLALYGETFPQSALRNFTFYAATHEVEDALLAAKAAYLRAVVTVGRDRGGAFDYTEATGNTGNVSGFKKRISLLLGFRDYFHRSLTAGIAGLGLKLVPAPMAGGAAEGTTDFAVISGTVDSEREFENIPLAAVMENAEAGALLEKCRTMVPGLAPLFPEQLLRSGVCLENFRMVRRGEGGKVLAMFRDEDNAVWRELACFPDKEIAINTVNALRCLCIQLNLESEGVHLAEHILLRPMAGSPHGETSFYSFRMSLLFPAWSTRCHDANFRNMAENVVRSNAPAHIWPDIHWLDFETMKHFEQLLGQWLEKKRTGSDQSSLDESSHALAEFLRNCGAVRPAEETQRRG